MTNGSGIVNERHVLGGESRGSPFECGLGHRSIHNRGDWQRQCERVVCAAAVWCHL